LRARRKYGLGAESAGLSAMIFGMDHHRAFAYFLSMISVQPAFAFVAAENRRAFCANAALRVRIMF
jgi:hypothetical protein